MNWDALGAIGEIIGAIGVIATLIYLSIQVRSSNTASETSSRQVVTRDYRQILQIHLDTEHARVFREGLWDYPNMEYDRRVKFATLIANEALFFQGVFAQYEAGHLEQETYVGYLTWFACQVSTPGGTAWWDEIARALFLPRMISEIDQRIAEGNLPDIRNTNQFGREENDAGRPPPADKSSESDV